MHNYKKRDEMKKSKIIIAGIALAGICIGFVIGAYILQPEGFEIKRYMGLLGTGLAMIIFVAGHLFSRNKAKS